MRIQFSFNRSTLSRTLLVLLGIALTSLAGYIILKFGDWAAFVPAAIPIGITMLAKPFFGALLVSATIPIENILVLGEGATFTRVLGIAVFGIWLTHKLMTRQSWKAIFSSSYFWLTLALMTFAFLSFWWATFPDDIFRPLFSLLQSFAYSLMIADLISNWKRLDELIKTLVASTFVAASLTLNQYVFGGILRAGSNISGGLNNTAQVLVTIVPFAFYLIQSNSRGFWRLLGLLYVVFAIGAVMVTLSRTSFILLGLLMLAEFWGLLRKQGARGWIVAMAGLALAIYVLYLPQQEITERVQSIGPEIGAILAGGSSGDEFSQRGFYYRVGWEIFLDHPLLGAGFENFRRLYLIYQYKVPGAERFFTDPRSPHNTYIGFLANLGVIGFGMWMAILVSMALRLRDAWQVLSSKRTSSQFYALQAVLLAFYLQLGYGMARPIEKEKLVWLLFGLVIALPWLLAERDPPANEKIHSKADHK